MNQDTTNYEAPQVEEVLSAEDIELEVMLALAASTPD
jgi:hypothetical protein